MKKHLVKIILVLVAILYLGRFLYWPDNQIPGPYFGRQMLGGMFGTEKIDWKFGFTDGSSISTYLK